MASPPKLTENASTPLSSDELAGDRAASAQTTDPLDKPAAGESDRAADEGSMTDQADAAAPRIEGDIALLPPG